MLFMLKLIRERSTISNNDCNLKLSICTFSSPLSNCIHSVSRLLYSIILSVSSAIYRCLSLLFPSSRHDGVSAFSSFSACNLCISCSILSISGNTLSARDILARCSTSRFLLAKRLLSATIFASAISSFRSSVFRCCCLDFSFHSCNGCSSCSIVLSLLSLLRRIR